MNLSRTVTVTIGQNDYDIKFPNTGQMLDIELLKLQLSDNKFDSLKFSYNPLFIKQAQRVEAIATFNTLIPKLKEDLNAKSMLDLEYEQMEEIETAYLDTFLPWYEEWLTALNPKTTTSKDAK